MNRNDNFEYKTAKSCGEYDNNQMESRFGYSVCEEHQSVPPAGIESKENGKKEDPIFGVGYNFDIYENLLSSTDMPEEQWKFFAEICMEKMLCQIRVAQRKMETLGHNIEMIHKKAKAN